MSVLITNQSSTKKGAYYYKDIQAVFKQAIVVCKLPKNISIGLILVDSEHMHQLNKTYRNKDKTTDVLTFVDDHDQYYLGDVFINMQQATFQAKEYQHSFRREFCFLFVHGLLHTIGYDHQDAQAEATMISLTEEILIDVAPKST